MQFIKTPTPEIANQAVLDRLSSELTDGKKVLWLMSGGSNISGEANILRSLRTAKLTTNLVVMLMDERYGPVGHADSNWQQLQGAGGDFTDMKAIAVMASPLKPMTETAAEYSMQVAAAFASADVVVGQFGLGADGHTAGILPNSPAAQAGSALVIGYHTPEYDRITLTRAALKMVDVGYVLAYGKVKLPALKDLHANQKPFIELPASLFSELPEVYVYNDQLEGDI